MLFRSAPLLLDLDFGVDAGRAVAADDAAADDGVSAPLLLDLAGFADSVRFDYNFDDIDWCWVNLWCLVAPRN